LKKLTITILAIYTALTAVFYFFQNQILFHEKPLAIDYKYSFEGNYQELWLKTTDSLRLNALHFKAKTDTAKGIVVYLHGNADNLSRWGKYAGHFTRNNYDILMVDYRGFGKNKGRFSEKGLLADGEAAYNYAQLYWPQNKIILYGRSLGSGIAAQLAAKYKPKMLLLETPYTSLPSIAAQFAPFLPYSLIAKYKLDTEAVIGDVRCPVHLFHGTADGLVHYQASLKLAQALNANPNQILTTIPDGKHRNLADFAKYHAALDSCLNQN
jgi:uncharacterized protein